MPVPAAEVTGREGAALVVTTPVSTEPPATLLGGCLEPLRPGPLYPAGRGWPIDLMPGTVIGPPRPNDDNATRPDAAGLGLLDGWLARDLARLLAADAAAAPFTPPPRPSDPNGTYDDE